MISLLFSFNLSNALNNVKRCMIIDNIIDEIIEIINPSILYKGISKKNNKILKMLQIIDSTSRSFS